MKKFHEILGVSYSEVKNSKKELFKYRKTFDLAQQNNLAVCGSVGIALSRKKASKLPNDIDFVTNDYTNAINFVADLSKIVWGGGMYRGKMTIQQQYMTDWVPSKAIAHIRVKMQFFIPICIFVRRKVDFRTWYCGGHMVQDYRDITSSKEEVEGRRRKNEGNEVEIEENKVETITLIGKVAPGGY